MTITVLTGHMIFSYISLRGNTLKVVRSEAMNYEQVEEGISPQWYK